MSVASLGELFAALGAGEWDRLLGTPESEWVEFKRDPYPLHTPAGRWELVKDVAALANARGGALVLGIETAKQQHEISDLAAQIVGVRRDLVNPDQYLASIEADIRPVLSVRFHWFPPEANGDNHSLFVIEVEALAEDDRYAIIRRMIANGERPIQALGVPVRRGAGVRWLSADEVHRLINEGIRSPKTPLSSRRDSSKGMIQRADKRVQDVELWQDWSDLPAYFLQALPPPGISLFPVLLERDGLRGALENVRGIRPLGWNLRTDGHSEVRDGALAYLRDSRRATVIEADGLVTVGAIATNDYLGWARSEPRPNQPWVVHPLSLVEFTYEVTRFLHGEVMPRARGEWTLLVSCRRFAAGRGVALPSGRGEWYDRHDLRRATSNEWVHRLPASEDPGGDAFELLVRVYSLFGHDSSAIPFAEGRRISEEMIRAVAD